jgi:hypothetical protein
MFDPEDRDDMILQKVYNVYRYTPSDNENETDGWQKERTA